MLDGVQWAGVRWKKEEPDVVRLQELPGGLGLVGALVVSHDDDVFMWCGCQVQELLQKRLSVGRVGPVGRHMDELTVIAANYAVDGHTASSGGLHRKCHWLPGCSPGLPRGVPQVY